MTVKPIEPGELLLHVGIHKTGTTALQSALADARTDLRGLGVTYPGTSTFQHTAVLAGLGRRFGWQEEEAGEVSRQPWDELVGQAVGTSIISSEFLDDVDPDSARRVIEDLGGVGRVQVAVTLRPIGAILPSAWQQRLKTGYHGEYNRFLKSVFAEQSSPRAQRFWYRHDQVAQVKRWADIVGPDRTHAVIIADGDRTAIFESFEDLLGVPRGLLGDRPVVTQNRSMTAAEAEFVRRINEHVVDALSWEEYLKTVRRGLVLHMVEGRRPDASEQRILTPKWAARKAVEYGQRFAEGLVDSGVQILGDPQALAASPRAGRVSGDISLPMDAAVAAAVAAVRAKTQPVEAAVAPTRGRALRSLLKPRRFRGA